MEPQRSNIVLAVYDASCRKLCRNQYVWVVNLAASMGFYVTVDFHSDKNGDQSFYDSASFKSDWAHLLRCVSTSVRPVNNGCYFVLFIAYNATLQ